MKTSPWTAFAKAESPDGRYTAVYNDAMEIGMGAPTRGVISVTEKSSGNCLFQLNDTNGSFVWSTDSSVIAFPRWTTKRMQQLVLLFSPNLTTEPLTGEYRVLELYSFKGGVIEGIDSPIHQPTAISVHAKKEPTARAD